MKSQDTSEEGYILRVGWKKTSGDEISVDGKTGLKIDCLDNQKVCRNKEHDQKKDTE